MKTKITFTAIGILLSLISNTLSAQLKRAFLISTLTNQNVYKTKADLTLKKVYKIDSAKAITDTTKYILRPTGNYKFIKYKVVVDGDNPYIRLLPYLQFTKISNDTSLITVADSHPVNTYIDPTDYYFQMTDDPTPNNHYLATESIMGMPLTMPVKLRQLDKNTKIELDFSLGYSFGYKIKCGNNPYRKKYINLIPLAFGVNKDNYFYKQANGDYSKEEESVSLTYYSFGVTYEYYGVNLGVFMGWDRMFNSQRNWVYQDKSWLSLGIGYKFGNE